MAYTQIWDQATNKPHDNVIKRDEDDAVVPFDLGNMDYCAYLIWLEAGNQPNAATPPAMTLPETVPVEDRVADLETRVDALESDSG